MRELERKDSTPAPTEALPAVAAIGRGRLGGSLAHAAETLGLSITLAGRDDALSVARSHTAVYLCVPDAAIETVCAELIGAGARPTFIGHASGARGLDALAAAEAAGCATFCLHPLQTFPTSISPIADIPAAIDGSNRDAVGLARNLATALGMRPFELPADARAAYHAAACMASNFLVALEESATELLAAAGIEGGRDLLTPLVLKTAANWTVNGATALTGPIARGDAETVERHLAAIEATVPELLPLYRALADRTTEIARAADAGACR